MAAVCAHVCVMWLLVCVCVCEMRRAHVCVMCVQGHMYVYMYMHMRKMVGMCLYVTCTYMCMRMLLCVQVCACVW